MGQHDKYLVKYAEGRSTNLGKAWNKIRSWKEFCTDLSTPTRTRETRAQFEELPKAEQDNLKMVSGWISPAQCKDNIRNLKNILPRNLIALDVDYCEVETVKAIADGTWPLARFESVTHSTRRHTERKPRLRVFFPLSRDVSAEECHALVRIVSFIFDGKRTPIVQVDKVSARPAQMMFRPTISKNGDWFYHHQEGELIDPDYFFALWKKKYGDPRDLSTLPLYDQEDALREHAKVSENPLTKRGVIGAFCRAYRIEDAMEKFIPDAYTQAEGDNRYMSATGTGKPGAKVYDGGLFLYSYHGHDAASEKNVNAFDLVRLHKFGHLDKEIETDNSDVTQFPSYKAMMELAREDEGVKYELASEQRAVLAQFEDESDEDETTEIEEPDEEEDLIGDAPLPKKSKKKSGEKTDFLSQLERDKQLRILPTVHNYSLILQNDPRLKGAIRLNEFTGQVYLCRTIKAGIDTIENKICHDRENGDLMEDEDDSVIRAILDAPCIRGGYGMVNHIGNLRDAVVNTARKFGFHPVKSYLESLVWDGKKRIDDLLVRYLQLEDNIYTREVGRLMLVASVARIYEPGHKFDFMAILEGPQGIRKSTFIKEIYGENWFGELDCKLDDKKEIVEQTPGIWGSEAAELDSLKKADAPIIKKFLRKTVFKVRLAYGHRATTYRIQSVFWGSTNETKYLRDPSGNRSFFPLRCIVSKGESIDTDALREERGQLWAEALAEYRRMRQEKPKDLVPHLPLHLSKEAENIADALRSSSRLKEIHEELADRMLEAADEPIRLSDLLREYGGAETNFASENETDPDTVVVQRCVLLRRDLIRFAYGDRVDLLTDQVKKTNFDKAEELFLKKWEHQSTSTKKFKRSVSGRWYTRKDAARTEQAVGYRVISINGEPEDLIG